MKNDLFSPITADQARFRPTYPPALFAYRAVRRHGHDPMGLVHGQCIGS
ncbi:MAG: hypothetical protein JST66_05510 [Bacteroidetes bacterium]|nr:hypothetical protein [Bacteroidota bacterium]